MQYNLFSPCKLGFIIGDSCISQLISITHEICRLPCDIRGVFLDISRAFDKVWHEGLIFKSKGYGIDGNTLNLLEHHLTGLRQRVILNSQTSFHGKIFLHVSHRVLF